MFHGFHPSTAPTVCRSEGKKDAPVPAAAPEEQEDGEVQMAAPVAQTAPGMTVCLTHHHVDVCVTCHWSSIVEVAQGKLSDLSSTTVAKRGL